MNVYKRAIALSLLTVFTFSCSKDKKQPSNQPNTSNPASTPGTVTTIAGSSAGDVNGPVATAQIRYPNGLTLDASGNIYIADMENEKIKLLTTSGLVSTFAGSTYGDVDGNGTSAQLISPTNIDKGSGSDFYMTDASKIKKITSSGQVITIAGNGTEGDVNGVGLNAQFNNPKSVVQDNAGNLYVADANNHKIKKIAPNGTVSTFAGSTQGDADGTGTNARFNYPVGLAIDNSGTLYLADRFNHKIKKISPSGVVTTIAGSGDEGDADGSSSQASFYNPYDVAVDGAGNVYVVDRDNSKIRKVSPSGQVTTVAGSTPGFSDGTGSAAQFSYPRGIAIDAAGNLYIADYNNHRIRKITF